MGNVRNTWYIDDITNTRSVLTNTTTTGVQSEIVNKVAIVTLIGEELNRKLKENNPNVNLNEYLGAIEFRFPSTEDATSTSTSIALRANINVSQYPVVGERVFVTQVPQGAFLYTNPINYNNNVNNNITGGSDEAIDVIDETVTYTSGRDTGGFVNIPDYEQDQPEFIGEDVMPIPFKPGDVVIEGRYANFMSFSRDSYDKPIISIGIKPYMNAANTLMTNQSTIMISSREGLVLPSFNRPVTYKNVSKEFSGNQITVLSDRIYIGSRANETFIMSNSNIHLASHGITTIDASDITTKTIGMTKIYSDFMVEIGKETGDKMEFAAKADTLIDLLKEILLIFSTHTHMTGFPQSAPPIISASKVTGIIAKLDKIKSKSVKIN